MERIAVVDWNTIKAEYIAGGGSMRKLANKYGVPFPTLRDRAKRESWTSGRNKVREEVVKETAQKTASAVANNAIIAEEIRGMLLQKLKKEVESLPDDIGSQSEEATIDNDYGGDKGKQLKQIKERRKQFNLRDLTTAYKNLTADMPKQEENGTMEKLDALLEVAWNAAHREAR